MRHRWIQLTTEVHEENEKATVLQYGIGVAHPGKQDIGRLEVAMYYLNRGFVVQVVHPFSDLGQVNKDTQSRHARQT